MAYKKEDFILIPDAIGVDVLINISQVRFIVEYDKGRCNFFFGSGEDDFVTITTTLEEFLELL